MCTPHGWCDYERNKYQYQIPCGGDSDCRFYDVNNTNSDGSLKLITASCIKNTETSNQPNGFGNTDETGCKDNPLEFHFSYSDSGEATPKVQVLDNWGWCSGRCTDSGTNYGASGMPNGGCYNDGGINDCSLSENGNTPNIYPWINYGGMLKIK